ncbi:MAG: S9 family peptidase [Gemmatimonadaceae bacterium]|nr:S9 family peptidase [Gemmatimonadaceae bacterium]
MNSGNDPAPPAAARIPSQTVLHGETRVDDYAWLRERSDPAVIAYLEAENAFTDAVMRPTEGLQQTLYDEMVARIREDDSQPPVRRDDWYYYSRTEQGRAYPIYCRRHGSPEAPEEVFFDQNEAASWHEYYQLGALAVSPDHRHLALLVDTSGYEAFTLRILDLATGVWLADSVDNLGFGLAWASDGATVFYTTTDEAKRSNAVWRHRIGAPTEADAPVYRDDDPAFNVGVARARDGRWVVVSSASFTSGETWLVDAHAPDTPPVCVRRRQPGVEYEVSPGGDWLYVLTNEGGARDFKVMRASASSPAGWREWLEHRPGVFVEGIDVFRRHAVVLERHDGLRRVRIILLGDHAAAAGRAPAAEPDSFFVDFPEPAYDVTPGSNPEFDTGVYRFTYSSFVTPDSVYDFDVVTRSRALLKRDDVLGGYDPAAYQVERIGARARDGAVVPISLVYRTSFARDGARPLLLYAYGAYGYSTEARFDHSRVSLLDRGFVFAIAHVRGGQEMGRAWYDDGRMMKKMNTFADFIDCAEHLITEGYTRRERLVARGGSAGGLLVGAVANMRPDLFRAIVADVPFVDVINTMLDDTIPLTAQEWEQWGNPRSREAYEYMRRYSPYDNVRPADYPAILATSGINDPRVAFWEPAKWVAKLRATRTGGGTLLLRMKMESGHGGASGRYGRIREQAFRYAFILREAGAA